MPGSQNPAKCLLQTGQVLPFSSNCIWSSEDNLVRKNSWLFFTMSVSIGLFGHRQERLALVNLSQKKKKKKLCWKAMGKVTSETNLWIECLKRVEHGSFGTLDIRHCDIIFGPTLLHGTSQYLKLSCLSVCRSFICCSLRLGRDHSYSVPRSPPPAQSLD